ncbi:MAG TPA: bifunctional UDP-sugar hydrolase/5'-nucleotidase [Polyangia bacterium]
MKTTIALLSLLSLLSSACSTVQRDTPDLRGQDVRITLLHTADTHSRLLPYNFVPGRNDQDLGLDPAACNGWACGGMSAAAPDGAAMAQAALGSGCRRIEVTPEQVKGIATRMGLPGPDAVTCQTLSARYTALCSAQKYPGTCTPDGSGGFVAWDCTCNYGGFGRIATVLRESRAQAGRSLHIDSGDWFQGAPIFNVFNGEAELRMVTHIGTDVSVLGNHEFDRGVNNLAYQLKNWAGFPVVAANYEYDAPNDFSRPWLGTLVAPYEIFNRDGLRVGVIGMGSLQSMLSLYEGGNSLGMRPLNTAETLRYYVALVRPQVDLLVIASHMGLDEDETAAVNEVFKSGTDQENQNSAQAGIDVILGGHLHIALNPPKLIPQRDKDGNPTGFNTILCHSGAFAKYVGRLDLAVHVGDARSADPLMSQTHVASYTYDLIPVDSRIPADGEALRVLEPYELELNRRLDLTKTFAFVGTADGSKIFRNDAGGGDSQIGNLVTLSMRVRNRVEADFAITNSLGIRTDFEYGAMTLEQMYNVFPFENSITTMFLSGSEVRETLDFVARKSADRGCRTQAQVSGIAFDMVCRRPSGCADPTLPKTCTADSECGDQNTVFCWADPSDGVSKCRKRAGSSSAAATPAGATAMSTGCADNIFIGDGCNICDVNDASSSCCNNRMLGGVEHPCACAPLNPYGTYKVAVNDYIAAGGSGFLVLKRNTTKYNTGISLRDALIDYLRMLPSRCASLIDDWNVTVPAGDRKLDARAWDESAGQCVDLGSGQRTTVSRGDCGMACIDLTVEPHDGRITPVLE